MIGREVQATGMLPGYVMLLWRACVQPISRVSPLSKIYVSILTQTNIVLIRRLFPCTYELSTTIPITTANAQVRDQDNPPKR